LEPTVFFFIIALVLIPLVAGYVANLVVGKNANFQMWELYVAGIIGSFVGGAILNLLFNGDLEISISGLIGSTVGAIVVLAVWAWFRTRTAKA
jgi:uncharacterized membrane protein YeaQ/YmgE (transglycosylase-associated protein family)